MTQTPQERSKLVATRLRGYLRLHGGLSAVLSNVYINGGPWESDMVRVMPSLYYMEYEIKVSLSDYRADFFKSDYHYVRNNEGNHVRQHVKRHDFLASSADFIGKKKTPRPRCFYFVCPDGMLVEPALPDHVGLIYVDISEEIRSWGVRVIRKAPILKRATKLSDANLFRLLAKVSYKQER